MMSDMPGQVLTYRYRLCPSKVQHAKLQAAVDHTRDLMNAALDERIGAYRKRGKSLTFYDQCKGLTELRSSDSFTTYSVVMQRWALKKIDHAFKAFFRRVKAGQTPGFPRFKGRDRIRAFGFADKAGWRVRGQHLIMKGIGAIRLSVHRALPGPPLTCVVRRYGKRWFACLTVRVPNAEAHNGPSVGLDMGVKHLATLSTGETIPNRRSGDRCRAAVRRAQRALARCKRGSKRRAKVKARLARLREREANARATHLHQVTADLTRHFSTIVLEDLKLSNMTRSAKGTVEEPGTNVRQKAGLNRSLTDTALGRFKELLTYKAERAGGKVITVDPKHTSQTCSACGAVDATSRRTRDQFTCRSCGHIGCADHNAAINIARRGGVLVPGGDNVGRWAERRLGKLV